MLQRSEVRGQRSAGRRGVALLEVIIGAVLLAIGLAVIISLASRALRTQIDGEKQMVAAWLADEYLNMVLVEGPVNYRKMYDTSGRCEYPFGEYEFALNLEDQGINFPFRVTATIRWPGASGDREVSVQTLIAERGGDPLQPRRPFEIVDREERWYGDQDEQ
ncbi:MAG: hypothetical protein L0Y44_00480 [Phycisphaerales bacterium]|nr:hypothetical protein [Phycisphaerales bacterium]MCI0629112.1 hypothetical protein [Phycisphaerales bacterium]MCI0675190.1 hypothetical protein [Phycisphaerales bacterium]